MPLHRAKIMNIYVGNLAEQTTEDELRVTFEAYGHVSRVAIITDKQSGRRRGFAFVEMDRDEEGSTAIAELDGTMLGDQALKVKEARSREERNGAHAGRTRRN